MSWRNVRKGISVPAAVASLAIAGVIFGGTGVAGLAIGSPKDSPEVQQSKAQAMSLSSAFRSAANKVTPAVVTIKTMPAEQKQVSAPNLQQFDNRVPEELRDHPMFKRFFDGAPAPRSPQPRGGGQGSGVIIDPSGIILTNNHVVKGGGTVVVVLQDGREFEATNVSTDPKTDVAVVKIDASETLVAAQTGDSDDVNVGDWVIAVGAPFGLRETVTAGIISAKARGIGITAREEFLQTDAAINPGNSGGPLVNLNGEVVGINTAISSTSGGYQGIGFAVPINMAQWVGNQLVTGGTVKRAFLGVGIQQVTSDLSRQLQLGTVSGAAVTDVRPDTPAADAGVQTGDVIVEFNGRSIDHPRSLQNAVERAAIDKAHKLVVMRKQRRIELTVRVSEMPKNLTTASDNSMRPADVAGTGLEVMSLSPDIASKLDMSGAKGVVITNVQPNSAADKSGLESKMVISRVGDTTVTTVDEFRQAMDEQLDDDGVLLLVGNSNGSRFVVLKK
jgi:serine protease Do